jgi:hypothetical protein
MMISLGDRLDTYQSLDFIDSCPYRDLMTTMTMTSAGTLHPGSGTETLDELAWAIDSDGIGCHEEAIARVVTRARALGVDPVLLDVLSDPAQPQVARERAFGTLSRTVASGRANHRPTDPRRIAA